MESQTNPSLTRPPSRNKMAALIRQANSGYELANKPKMKMKDVLWKRRERKQNNDNNNKQTLSEKKEEAGNM